MPRVRSEEQLQLAVDAPPRPEKKDAGGDKARWRELQRNWVAAWKGQLLDEADACKEAIAARWWKQSKTRHKALLRVAASSKENANAVAAPTAPPAKVAAVRLAGLQHVTAAWLQRRAPQISSLSTSTGKDADGNTLVTLKALVGGEEREAFVHYSEEFDYDGLRENVHRKREETALLQLASGAEREAAKRARQRARQEAAAQSAPERARRKKLRLAEWRRRRRLSEPFKQVLSPSRSPCPIKTMCMCHMCM